MRVLGRWVLRVLWRPVRDYQTQDSRDRLHPEPADPLRGPYELDRHRIIESAAFRRLEGKTQVFAPSLSDHFRTRLTHTFEVASIARTLAKGLGANVELAEAITLAHDLGHPPFGHAGEKALNGAMAGHGGFDHNAHSLRVVEYLEHPFPAFRGLNLTRATLAGLRAHCTRYDRPGPPIDSGAGHHPSARETISVEGQIASLADRIAYNCHDLEDAIGAGFFGLPELDCLTLWREAYAEAGRQWTDRSIHAIRRGTLDTLLQRLLADAISTSTASRPSLRSSAAETAVRLSLAMENLLAEVEQFLLERMYRHPKIVAMDAEGQEMILSLFAAYQRDPSELPERFAARVPEQGVHRVVCDYMAGMTDRFCAREHEKLCTD